jgi:hypothetical protein
LAWGGARPGAGRKKKETETYQQSRRTQLEQIITDPEWAEVVKAMLKEMKAGNVKALAILLPFIVGAPPKAPEEGADTSLVVKPDL